MGTYKKKGDTGWSAALVRSGVRQWAVR